MLKIAPLIKTDHLILRPLSKSDAPDIFEYSRNPNVGPNAGWKPHETLEETESIMEAIFLNQDAIWGICLKETPVVIGSLGLIQDPKRSENPEVRMLGYALAFAYWGQGIMTEAVCAVCQFGFQTLRLQGISAYTFPFNERSKSVLKKAGFAYEGRLKMVEYSWDGKQILDNDCYLRLPKDK